jgi:dTMP kinase|tara:strand:+ start:7078 stop:7734 length:657 start_codon:yes stop_codon:yes gene_type:complete
MNGVTRAASRGAFVLFEGADRCGKSTQAARLVAALNARGVAAELWRYPDRTTAMGKMIDEYLRSKAEMTDGAIHLLFAANRWEKKELMERKLREGVTLVCDRYSYSGVAFTAAKNAPGLDLNWCRAPEIGLPRPDALLYLELSLEEAARRGGFGEERYETTEIQRAVKQSFDDMKEGWWNIIDANRDMDVIQSEVLDIAVRTVEECKAGAELKRLWEK